METEVLEPETALATIPHDAHLMKAPKEVLEGARLAAVALKEVIANKRRPVVFRGEQYLQFEDWQTVGGFFGSSVATGDAELVEIDGVRGFKAKAHVIDSNGIEVSTAEAYCMKDEDNWKNKPLFQLASMAQTRAGAKALRNKFAWVAVLAGYSPTPAEEMTGQESSHHEDQAVSDVPDCPDCGGPMWDNRTTKKGKQPDYKCKDRGCNKAVWLPKEPITEGYSEDQILRDQYFAQAEKLMSGIEEGKRKDALGRLLMLSTEDMGKKVLELAENAKKKRRTADPEQDERQKMIEKIETDVDDKSLTDYMTQHYEGMHLSELSLEALNKLYNDLYIPF